MPPMPHTAFCQNHNALAHPGNFFQHGAKDFFRLPPTINIRVVKKRVARLVRRNHRLPARAGIARVIRQPPAPVSQPAALQ